MKACVMMRSISRSDAPRAICTGLILVFLEEDGVSTCGLGIERGDLAHIRTRCKNRGDDLLKVCKQAGAFWLLDFLSLMRSENVKKILPAFLKSRTAWIFDQFPVGWDPDFPPGGDVFFIVDKPPDDILNR